MYKKKKSLEKRKQESESILKKYPCRIPVIVEKSSGCKDINEIDKTKYLVPDDLTMGQFIFVIRKRIKITPEKALFVFINNKLIATHSLMSQVYNDEKEEDNFLYVHYSSENTFG